MSVKAVNSRSSSFPKSWKVVSFEEAFSDATGGNAKIKQSEYQKIGAIPVIDQGQEYVAGYIDDSKLCCRVQLPVVLFGDHTKIFKFVSEPFALGADGVKVLLPSCEVDAKFGYYFLSGLKLPDNTGYSRHYKYLKEAFIPLPTIPEQRRIAAILDKADAIRRKRQESIRLTEEFLRSVFLDMFGDPVTNPKGWETATIRDLVSEVKYGTSEKASYEGSYPILRMNNITYEGGWKFTDLKRIDIPEKDLSKYLVQKGDILFNRTNSKELVGKTAVYGRDEPMAYAGYLIRIRPNKENNSEYIAAYLNSKHGKATLEGMCKSIIGMANINAQEIQDIKILKPPTELQNRYGLIVKSVERRKARLSAGAEAKNTLFNSLVQRAFRGEL